MGLCHPHGPVLVDELTKNNSTHYLLPDGAWQDGVLHYHGCVTETWERGPMNSCMLGRSMRWGYSGVR